MKTTPQARTKTTTEIFEGAPPLGKHQNDIQTLAHELLSNLQPLKDAERCIDARAKVVGLATRLA